MSSLQKSVADVKLNEAGEGIADRRVRFVPGCHEAPKPKAGQRTRGCCDEFMEQTISVHEIERIFDIDFDKVTYSSAIKRVDKPHYVQVSCRHKDIAITVVSISQ